MSHTYTLNHRQAACFTPGRGGNRITTIVIHHWDDPARTRPLTEPWAGLSLAAVATAPTMLSKQDASPASLLRVIPHGMQVTGRSTRPLLASNVTLELLKLTSRLLLR